MLSPYILLLALLCTYLQGQKEGLVLPAMALLLFSPVRLLCVCVPACSDVCCNAISGCACITKCVLTKTRKPCSSGKEGAGI